MSRSDYGHFIMDIVSLSHIKLYYIGTGTGSGPQAAIRVALQYSISSRPPAHARAAGASLWGRSAVGLGIDRRRASTPARGFRTTATAPQVLWRGAAKSWARAAQDLPRGLGRRSRIEYFALGRSHLTLRGPPARPRASTQRGGMLIFPWHASGWTRSALVMVLWLLCGWGAVLHTRAWLSSSCGEPLDAIGEHTHKPIALTFVCLTFVCCLCHDVPSQILRKRRHTLKGAIVSCPVGKSCLAHTDSAGLARTS